MRRRGNDDKVDIIGERVESRYDSMSILVRMYERMLLCMRMRRYICARMKVTIRE